MSEGTEAGNCISWGAGNSIPVVLLELVLEAVAREGGGGRRNRGHGASWRLAEVSRARGRKEDKAPG